MKQINFITEKLKLSNNSKLKSNDKFWMLIHIKYDSSIALDFNHMFLKRIIFTYSEKQDEMLEVYLINVNEFKEFFSSLSFLRRHSTDFISYEIPDKLSIDETFSKNEIDKYVENELNDIVLGNPKWNFDNLQERDITYFINLNNYNTNENLIFYHPDDEKMSLQQYINEKLTLNSQSKLKSSFNGNKDKLIEFCKFLSDIFKDGADMIDLDEVEAMLGEDPLGIISYIEYNDPWKGREFNDFTLREKMLLCEFVNAYINKKDYDKSLKFAIDLFNNDKYYADWVRQFKYHEN